MSTTTLIVVMVLGVILMTLEVFLPGGIAGFFGVLMLAFGVWQTYHIHGEKVGVIVLLCCTALMLLMIVFLLRKRTWRRFSLEEEMKSRVNEVEKGINVGSRGRTISRLAPTGNALIEGKQMEVHAVNKFIDPDREVEVVRVDGYRIDVVECSDDRFSETPEMKE